MTFYFTYTRDSQAMQLWQNKLLVVAKEARLSQRDTKKLSGNDGYMFLEFHGKRLNYDDEFMQRLLDFEPLELLFARYPHFTKLHEVNLKLQNQRDNLIRQRAEALAQSPQSQDLIELAKKEWQAYFVTTLPQ